MVTYPEPEPGLVISYAFRWSDEAAGGHAEGSKNRPCAIVLVTTPDACIPDSKRVAVLPITHTRPQDPDSAIELPEGVKRHLGLDEAQSWVALDELNMFVWPGFDLRQIPGQQGRYAYGFLPPRFLDRVRDRLRERRVRGQIRAIGR